jgi:hypothetical protein
MFLNMRDPFANIAIDDLRDGLSRYPAIEKLFNRRCRKLVEKGLPFYELPLLYKWLLVPGDLGLQKLGTLDKCLTNLNGCNTSLDRKIRNLDSSNSDDQVFRLLTEFLVISNLVLKGIADFQYEDVPGSDISFHFESLRVRIQITHKEDVYPLADTADKLSINLEYASPDSGGDIRVAPPVQQNHSNGSIVRSRNMTEDELRTTISNALGLMRSNPSEPTPIPCSNPSFSISLDPRSRHWGISWGRSCGISLGNPSNDPYIRSYVDSIKRKAGKSLEIRDGSYMILAVDFIPASLFGPNSRLRDLLRNQLLALNLACSSNFNEVTSFTMRFETGQFESLDTLWQRDATSRSVFLRLVQ